MRGSLACLCLLVASLAHAQTKPLGVFDPGTNPPSWAQFGTISDTVSDERFVDAAQMSEATGFLWLLQLGYHEDPRTPIGPHAGRVLDRLRSTGLLPYVVAVSVGEEWYEYCLAGEFARYGVGAGNPACVPVLHDWMGKQHLAAKTALGVPVVWITTLAHPTYRPIPAHTDIVALDPYMGPGGSFDAVVAPVLAMAEQATPLPLVVIPQWFEGHGFPRPRASDVAKYFDWLTRPRWIALLGFTWRTRDNGIVGLSDLPDIRTAIEARK